MGVAILLVDLFLKQMVAASSPTWQASRPCLGPPTFPGTPRTGGSRTPSATCTSTTSWATCSKLMVYFAMAVTLLYSRGPTSPTATWTVPSISCSPLFATLGMMVMISAKPAHGVYRARDAVAVALRAGRLRPRFGGFHRSRDEVFRARRAFASGLLLYGMSMIYSATGSLRALGIAQPSTTGRQPHGAGCSLVFRSPARLQARHWFPSMWVPDVYHGAPTAVTLLISTAPKLGSPSRWPAPAGRTVSSSSPTGGERCPMFAIVTSCSATSPRSHKVTSSACSPTRVSPHGLHAAGLSPAWSTATPARPQRLRLGHVLRGRLCADEPHLFGMVILLSRSGFEAGTWTTSRASTKRSPWFASDDDVRHVLDGPACRSSSASSPSWRCCRPPSPPVTMWLAVLAVMMSLVGAFYYLRRQVMSLRRTARRLAHQGLARPAGAERPMASPSRCSADALQLIELRSGAGRSF